MCFLKEYVACAAAGAELSVDEYDFSATYAPETNCWTAARKWTENMEPSVLQNKEETYFVP